MKLPDSLESAASPPPSSDPVRRAAWWGEVILLIMVPLVIFAVVHKFAPTGDPNPELVPSPTPAPFLAYGEEAAELSAIRQEIERQPRDVAAAIASLRDFVVRADDSALKERALRWKRALEASKNEHDYQVRLKRFLLNEEAYKSRFNSIFEPGEPDVFVRVFRTRDGEEELVYDDSGTVVEGWSGNWDAPERREVATFNLSWKIDQPIRVELLEADVFADDVIAEYRIDRGLSILLLSSARISVDGDIVEFESTFEFGR